MTPEELFALAAPEIRRRVFVRLFSVAAESAMAVLQTASNEEKMALALLPVFAEGIEKALQAGIAVSLDNQTLNLKKGT